MREVTVRIRFTKHSIGNVKSRDAGGIYRMPSSPDKTVVFMSTWHEANMRFAAKILGRHQDEVGKIRWDIKVDGVLRRDGWYRRYFPGTGGKQRYCRHEAFMPAQTIGLNCVVPPPITDEDLWELMQISGTYRGLSPYGPLEFGMFEVVSIRPRRPLGEESPIETEKAK